MILLRNKELASFESDNNLEIQSLKAAKDEITEELEIERQRCEGLLKSLNKLQAMVKELETLRGKISFFYTEVAQRLKVWLKKRKR